ncbi:MAG TPA: DUF1178 family protein [Desulfobacterales bacterium]|nr:DUF1178 family protein [Desulfobacterales bacterium]
MIIYDLQCSNGHTFEGWFEDVRAYEDQKKKNLITCPVCNVTSVSKVPSTFAIKSSQVSKDVSEPKEAFADLSKKVMDFVEKNFDNVGSDFAREALKIHYGVSEPRNIRGVSTQGEEKTLKEEGVQFFKIPMPTTSTDTETE